jgi:uncharacterized membrane protein YdjX (TVP38/TMEM64 family)
MTGGTGVNPKKKQYIFLIIVSLVALGILAIICVDLAPIIKEVAKNSKNETETMSYIKAYGNKAVPLLLCLQIIVILIPGIPANSISILSGLCYGVLWGSVISVIGNLISNSIIFCYSKEIDGIAVKGKSSGKAAQLVEHLIGKAKTPSQAIFIAYIIPFVPNMILPMIFLRRGVSYKTFILSAACAVAPMTFLYCLLGDRISSGDYKSAIIIVVVLVAVIGVVYLLKSKFTKK